MSTATHARRPPVRRRVGWVVAVLAAVVALSALALAGGTLAYTLRAGEASGEVVARDEVPGPDGRPTVPATYRMVIEFPDHNGQFRRFQDTRASDAPPEVGAEVRVLYDRRRPADARVEDLWLLYADALVAVTWALGLGIVGEELLRGGRRRPARQQVGPVQLLGNRAR